MAKFAIGQLVKVTVPNENMISFSPIHDASGEVISRKAWGGEKPNYDAVIIRFTALPNDYKNVMINRPMFPIHREWLTKLNSSAPAAVKCSCSGWTLLHNKCVCGHSQ